MDKIHSVQHDDFISGEHAKKRTHAGHNSRGKNYILSVGFAPPMTADSEPKKPALLQSPSRSAFDVYQRQLAIWLLAFIVLVLLLSLIFVAGSSQG